MKEEREAAIADICTELLGRTPDSIETPGGSSRESVRARFGDQSLIVTHRKELQRARLEALVLRTLGESSAAVPRLIAWRGPWIMQQDVGTTRLSEAMHEASDEKVTDLLNAALNSLVYAQRAGNERGLPKHLVKLGEKRPWFDKLLSRRFAVGDLVGVTPPNLQDGALVELLRLREPCFIKWDARPGNAIVASTGARPAAASMPPTASPAVSAESAAACPGNIARGFLTGLFLRCEFKQHRTGRDEDDGEAAHQFDPLPPLGA